MYLPGLGGLSVSYPFPRILRGCSHVECRSQMGQTVSPHLRGCSERQPSVRTRAKSFPRTCGGVPKYCQPLSAQHHCRFPRTCGGVPKTGFKVEFRGTVFPAPAGVSPHYLVLPSTSLLVFPAPAGVYPALRLGKP